MYIITRNKYLAESSLASLAKVNGDSVCFADSDTEALRLLKEAADNYSPDEYDGIKMSCTLVLDDITTLTIMLTAELSQTITSRLDLFITTPEDIAVKKLFASGQLFLDRTAIGQDDAVKVHLVVVGMSQLAESIMVNAALVAHYPNYCFNHTLRTRITVVDDDAIRDGNHFRNRYHHLFESSYYRTIDLDDTNPSVYTHKPIYEESREDYVDIEWEFVKGNIYSDAVRTKLSEWSQSDNQQLTIAIAHDNAKQSVSEAYNLPEEVYTHKIPVLCYSPLGKTSSIICNDNLFACVRLFSVDDIDIAFIDELRRMAMCVNYVYNRIFTLGDDEPKTAPVSIDMVKAERMWQDVTTIQKKYSNIYNAMTLFTKLHSIGHEHSQDRNSYYALSMKEIMLLMEVEHNRWNVEELILGYRPVTDMEQKEIESDATLKEYYRAKRIHYDIRAFNDLRKDQTGKNVNIYDWALTQAIPLIIETLRPKNQIK